MKKNKTKCNNIVKQCQLLLTLIMLQKKTSKNCPQFSDHPYRLLIIVGSRSGKK